MVRFEITGKIEAIGDVTVRTGRDGREWQNQTLVIDASAPDSRYHDSLAVRVDDRLIDVVAQLGVGDTVKVVCGVKSREWQGRWYTDVDLIQVSATLQSARPAAPAAPLTQKAQDDDLPFGN